MKNIISDDVQMLSKHSYWRDLQGKRVLITGATGLLGSYLAYAIAKNCNAELYLLCRNKNKAAQMFFGINCHFIFQDVCEPLKIDTNIDYILHTAGPVGPSIFEALPIDVISVNIAGTLLLIDYAVKHNCQGLAYASTHEVYGMAAGEQYESSFPRGVDLSNPRSCYVLAKQTTENALVCATKQYGLRTLSARFSRLYGPLMNLDSGLFICDFIKDALVGNPVHVRGGLNLLRPLTYIADAADAMLQILVYGISGEAYNVQADEPNNIGDIARIISSNIIADKLETHTLPLDGHWLNCDKLKLLGWQHRTPLKIGLKRTIEYFADQRN